MDFEATFGTAKPVIGMVHLPALPGAPSADADIEALTERAVADARTLAASGVDGLLVENYGDTPFYPDDVPKHTVAAMTRAATAVSASVDLPLGVNVLRNDAEAALSVAAAVGGSFVRVNVHTGVRIADQGILSGRAHETIRLRERLGVGVRVFADLDVKHSAPLADGRLADRFADQIERGLADAVVLTGSSTGEVVDDSVLETAIETRNLSGPETPLVVGSGVDDDNVAELLDLADGVIVGTALKEGGETTAPVDRSRVEALLERTDAVR